MGSASWIWIAIIGAVIGVYYLYKQGRVPWLKGIKMPRLKVFEPKPEDVVEKLKAQTEREMAKAEELRAVLEAKKGLARVKAENIRLRKEIDGVSEKSVEREKRVAELEEREAKKAKPKRL